MSFSVVNTHTRALSADADSVDALVSTLGTPHDALWPTDRWFPMVLDGPLEKGGTGGHGPVGYHCTERAPGRARFEFDAVLRSRAWRGYHQFTVEPSSAGSTLQHVIRVRLPLLQYLLWLVMVRPLHDALLEDLLDRAQGVTGRRWSVWVRFLRAVTRP
jgi:hypothetical protein